MDRFVYRNKKTGQKIYSDRPLDLKDLELVSEVKDTRMKSAEVRKKKKDADQQ
jgi:hypothetical protein